MLDTALMLTELSVMEQRYQAVSLVVHDGESVVKVACRFEVSRQAVHRWLARYVRSAMAGLTDRSHRPVRCSRQMAARVEVLASQMKGVGSSDSHDPRPPGGWTERDT